jgi:hypothetical protein
MSFYRYVPKPLAEPLTQPFETVEEAWFWYCRSQIARLEGARFRSTDSASVPRPCDPDDIFAVVDRLYKARELERRHLVVLGDYGLRLAAPMESHVEERAAARCWEEAMLRLHPVLKAKGIVL